MNIPIKPVRPTTLPDLHRHLQTLDSMEAYEYGKDAGIDQGYWVGWNDGGKCNYMRGFLQGLAVGLAGGISMSVLAFLAVKYG